MNSVYERVARCGIAVMAKASLPGRVKTRLVPPLTGEEAAAFNSAFLRDVFANIVRASRESSIQGYAAFGPPDQQAFFDTLLPDGIRSFPCWADGFGRCLHQAICTQLDRGHAAAVVLNADSPTLPTALLVETAEVLAQPGDRAVIGPSDDGGYYLLGIKARHARLFEDVAWSTERVAGQTLERAAEIGLTVHRLPVWYDVDDRAALAVLHGELFDGRAFGDGSLVPNEAANTRALMAARLAEGDFAARIGRATPAALER